MSDFTLFGEETNALALHTPIDALFNQHALELSDLQHLSQFVEDKHHILCYFKEGLAVKEKNSYFSTTDFFNFESAKRALDSKYWAKVMSLTDILEVMPAERRNEWSTMMREHQITKGSTDKWRGTKAEIIYIPSFDRNIVMSTIGDMLQSRDKFLAERVDGLFKNLSSEHVTNVPEGFSKRMIINYIFSYGSISSERANYIHDLRCVIAKFMGRDSLFGNETYRALCNIKNHEKYGQWHVFDGGAWKIRIYKKGTAHIEIHPDMSYRLNMMLAMLHPMAIPAQFRTKTSKKTKEHELHTDLLPFRVIKELGELQYKTVGKLTKSSSYEKLNKSTIEVLQMLGGNYTGGYNNSCEFDYDVQSVIRELTNSGMIPDKVSHQFYPTPEELAQVLVDTADIKENDLCLEPSAGMGGIADFMPKDRTTCIEINKLHVDILNTKGFNDVVHKDFLTCRGAKFDVICMNPPFSDGRALEHLKHATTMLEDDGRLVCILPASNENKQLITGFKHEYSEIYSNMFKGTGVSIVILKLTKE